ncbi:MAG: hypothetical protein SPI94_04770 [Candidatus Onthovivens sp.]|nr:hypothetical protein [Candidatus Onthovivens sp.]
MKISEEKKELLEDMLLENCTSFNCGLTRMIIKDFVDRVEEYEENELLENIISDITGLNSESYNCSTYESAKLIAENIFEFNEIAEEMIEQYAFGKDYFDITETEKNLVKVLYYICENTILNQDCETLEELINKIDE